MQPNRRDQRAVRQPEPLGDMFRLSSYGLDVPDSEWVDANETLTLMLQIGLATGEFRSGRYVRGHDWDDNWNRDDA